MRGWVRSVGKIIPDKEPLKEQIFRNCKCDAGKSCEREAGEQSLPQLDHDALR